MQDHEADAQRLPLFLYEQLGITDGATHQQIATLVNFMLLAHLRVDVMRHVIEIDSKRVFLYVLNPLDSDLNVFCLVCGRPLLLLLVRVIVFATGVQFLEHVDLVNAVLLQRFVCLQRDYLIQV